MLVGTWDDYFETMLRLQAEENLREYAVAILATEWVRPEERESVLARWHSQSEPRQMTWREQVEKMISMVRQAFGGNTVQKE